MLEKIVVPIYEFTCQNCGAEFEKLVSFSDNLSVNCPVCQSSQVQRQLGLPAVHFKGSGWYITDSKGSNKESDKAKTSSAKTTADETGGSTKSSEQDSKNSAQGNSSASSNGRQEGTGASVQEK
jgi:putative FmdB family regulatory protein